MTRHDVDDRTMDPLGRVRAILLLRRAELVEAQRALGVARAARARAEALVETALVAREGAARALDEALRWSRDAWLGARGITAARLARGAAAAGLLRDALDATAGAAQQAAAVAGRGRDEEERARGAVDRALAARQAAERELSRRERGARRDRARREAMAVEDRGAAVERGGAGRTASQGAPRDSLS